MEKMHRFFLVKASLWNYFVKHNNYCVCDYLIK